MRIDKKLQHMLENTELGDNERLDEIDARFHCFLNGLDYRSHDHLGYVTYENNINPARGRNFQLRFKKCSRSRDLLKAARPSGVRFECVYSLEGYTVSLCSEATEVRAIRSKPTPSEEFAEYHALIGTVARSLGYD